MSDADSPSRYLGSSQNISFYGLDSSAPDSGPSSGRSTSSSGSNISNNYTVTTLSANLAGSRATNVTTIMDNVINNGQSFTGELQNRRKHYVAIHPMVGVKAVKVIYTDKEITKQFKTLPGESADLSVPLEKKKLLLTLRVHKEHSILCIDLPKSQIKEIVTVCRVRSLPGFEHESEEDPGFAEWTLNIKVVSKEPSPTTPRKTKKQSSSDNSPIDESACSSPASDKPVSVALQVRKVLVLVPSAQTSYFDSVCASLKQQKFKEQKNNGNMALFTLSTATAIAERIIVVKYSLDLYRDIESIASGADYILLKGNEENQVDKPHIVKRVGDLSLTSGKPNKFSVCATKPLDSFEMLESNILCNLMKSGSTLWLVPNEIDAPTIANALHLTLTSYQLRPCSRDLFTCWIFEADELTEAACEQPVTDKLNEIDPHMAQVELTCHCCIAVIVRSDMWLWHLIDMMDDTDFVSLGPAFKSVRQIDVRDVKKFQQNSDNYFYLDELVALQERIQASAYPLIENKMRRDMMQHDAKVQIPLKRSCESINIACDRLAKKQRVEQSYSTTLEHAHDRNMIIEPRHELTSPNGLRIEGLTSKQALQICADLLKGHLRAIAPKDFHLLALAQHFLKLVHESFYPEYKPEVAAFAALAFALSPNHPSYPLLRFTRSDIKDILLIKECTTFGRIGCDILFRGEKRISAKHCTIKKTEDLFFIEDTSSNGTYLDGDSEPIGKRNLATLSNGTHVTFVSSDNEYIGFIFYIQDENQRSAKDLLHELERHTSLSPSDAVVSHILSSLALICSATPRSKQILIHVGKQHSSPSYDDETSQEIAPTLNRSLSSFSQ